MNKELKIENLNISIFDEVEEMGQKAADFVEEILNKAIADKGSANLILATGASQFSFLKALKDKKIDWDKITVFHLDEYEGMSDDHPASFRKYLKDRILNHVKPKKVYYLNGDAEDVEKEMLEYAKVLQEHPIDIACIGVGENGHIAFNDPPVADFKDPKLVKLVELDDACRNQQYGEGWFPTFDDVPRKALTLTIPAIMGCKAISCVVPDDRKAKAVYDTIYGALSTDCPATILRTHKNVRLFLDKASASRL